MRRLIIGGLAVTGALVLGVIVAGTLFVLIRSDGFSARDEPSALEAVVARRLRLASIPARARESKNPLPDSPDVLAEAREHYADHCAICHGADGRGRTQMGQALYPKVPDMRGADTQALSDGEIFFIIENGIRFTGMPAWSHAEAGESEDSWKLAHLIRRMPRLTIGEVEEIKQLMPKGGHQHGGGDSSDGPHGAHEHLSHRDGDGTHSPGD